MKGRAELIAYLKHKVEICDWHGASDACNDLRVLEAMHQRRVSSESSAQDEWERMMQERRCEAWVRGDDEHPYVYCHLEPGHKGDHHFVPLALVTKRCTYICLHEGPCLNQRCRRTMGHDGEHTYLFA